MRGFLATVVSRETAVCVLLGVAAGVLGSELGLQQLGVAGSALVGVLLTRMLEERIERWRTSRVWLLTALFAAWEWLGKLMGGLRRALGLAGQGMQATAGAVAVSVGVATAIAVGVLGATGELAGSSDGDGARRAEQSGQSGRPPAGAETLIEPQRGIGGVYLGMREGRLMRALGRPDEERSKESFFGELVEARYRGLWVSTISGSAVVAVRTKDPRYRTESGVGVGSSEAEVRAGVAGVRCRTIAGGRGCSRGDARATGGRLTTFSLGLPGRRVTEVTVAAVVD